MALKDAFQAPKEPKPRTVTRVALEKFGDAAFDWIQHKFEKKSALDAERAGERLGRIHFRIDSKHRNRCYANLRLVFKDWPEDKVRSVGKDVFIHFGRVAGDFLRSPIRTNQEVLDSIEEIIGMEHVEEAEARGKGVLFVTGHFGNWERLSQWITATGRKLNVIAREANQEGVQERVLQMREKVGATVLSTGNSARHAILCLRRNEWMGLLADQNSKEANVPFFGLPSGTVTSPAVMHSRTDAALLPGYCVRTGPCKYRIIFQPLVDPQNEEEDKLKVMADLNSRLEEVIREYPEQWLWMHDRWKLARRAGLLDEIPTP